MRPAQGRRRPPFIRRGAARACARPAPRAARLTGGARDPWCCHAGWRRARLAAGHPGPGRRPRRAAHPCRRPPKSAGPGVHRPRHCRSASDPEPESRTQCPNPPDRPPWRRSWLVRALYTASRARAVSSVRAGRRIAGVGGGPEDSANGDPVLLASGRRQPAFQHQGAGLSGPGGDRLPGRSGTRQSRPVGQAAGGPDGRDPQALVGGTRPDVTLPGSCRSLRSDCGHRAPARRRRACGESSRLATPACRGLTSPPSPASEGPRRWCTPPASSPPRAAPPLPAEDTRAVPAGQPATTRCRTRSIGRRACARAGSARSCPTLPEDLVLDDWTRVPLHTSATHVIYF